MTELFGWAVLFIVGAGFAWVGYMLMMVVV